MLTISTPTDGRSKDGYNLTQSKMVLVVTSAGSVTSDGADGVTNPDGDADAVLNSV